MTYDTRERAKMAFDVTTTPPTNGQGLIYNSTSSKWVPGAAGGVTVYSTIDDLPLSGISTGSLALVDSTNRLYLWMDTGWYNIATINTNPQITAGNNTPYLLALDGTPTVITLTASDPEGIPLTWSYEVTSGSLTNGGGTTATVSNDGSGQFTITPTTTEDYAGAFSLTFKASDGVNLGTTVASFTLAFRVLDSKYTSLLVKALASGANSTFVDSSTNGFTITKNGDVTQGTFSPFSQPELNWSTYLNGTSHFQSPVNSAIAPTTDTTWTIEFMAFVQDFSNNPIVMTIGVYGSNINSRVSFNTSGNLEYYSGSNTWGYTATATSSSAMTANKWHHCVLVRDAGSLIMYIDGTEVYNAAFNFGSGNTGYIVFGSYFGQASQYFNGYLSNFRYTKSNVYGGTVTAPINGLDVLANTSLLVSQKNRFVDSAGTVSLTRYGSPAISPFSPFDRLAYDPAIHGGGAYFDGTGDYLSATYTPSLMDWWSTDYTLEVWVYPTTFAGWSYLDTAAIKPVLIGNKDVGGTTNYWCFGLNTSGNVYFAYWNGTPVGAGTTSTATLNAWNHIALVNNGGALTLYLNGVGTSIGNVAGTPLSSTSYPLSIGAANNTYINGYVSNMRMTKGTALYTSNFSPATAPLTQTSQGATATEVELLLNCTNANIIDNDSKNNLKLVGNTAASSTQTKYAARSVYFDGTGDYILSPASPIGTSDFTVEAWFYTSNLSTYMCILDTRAGSAPGFALYSGATGGVTYTNNTSVVIEAGTASSNAWNHIALVRSSGTVSLYLNGTSVGSATDTRTFTETIYTIGSADGGAQPFNGYIEDLRITKGLARYTANFTPPTSELLG